MRLTTKRKYRRRLQNSFSDKVEAFRFKNRTLPWRRNFVLSVEGPVVPSFEGPAAPSVEGPLVPSVAGPC